MPGRARVERHLLAATLEEVGPDAPTLCEGWTALDMAAHVVCRERTLRAGLGLAVPRLHAMADLALIATKRDHTFAELVAKVAAGPRGPHPSRLRPLDDLMNGMEFFIHVEDVRRAQPGAQPRELDAGTRDFLWRSVKLVGLVGARRAGVGLRARRTDAAAAPKRLRTGEPAATIAGPAPELLLYLSGRRDAARVEWEGDPAAIAAVQSARLGL